MGERDVSACNMNQRSSAGVGEFALLKPLPFFFQFGSSNKLRKQCLICSWFCITSLCGLQVTAAEFSHIHKHWLYKGKITAVRRKHQLFLLHTFRYSLRTKKKAMTHNSQSSKMKQKALGVTGSFGTQLLKVLYHSAAAYPQCPLKQPVMLRDL